MFKRKPMIITISIISIILVISIACAVLVPKKDKSKNNFGYGKTEIEENVNSENNNEGKPTQELTYFVNTQNVSKSIEFSGETKIFKISFNVFVKNSHSKNETIFVNGFELDYNMSKHGTLLSSLCKNDINYVEVQPNGIIELEFEIKYVITDSLFMGIETFDLKINYFNNLVYSGVV